MAGVRQLDRFRTDDQGGLAAFLALRVVQDRQLRAEHIDIGLAVVLLLQLHRDEVRLADEVRDELGSRLVIDLPRRAHLLHMAAAHDNDVVGDGHCLGLVVGDVDRGDTHLLLDLTDLGTHGDTQLCVQVGQRLVEEQDARLQDQGSRQRDTLLLTAGQLVRHTGFHAVHLDQLQDVQDLLTDHILRELAELQSVSHVVEHVDVRQQSVALEHHCRVSLVGRQVVDCLAADIDLALVRALESRDHAEDGGLSAAGGAEQGDELTGFHIKVDILDRVKRLLSLRIFIDLGNMIKAYALFLFCHVRPPLPRMLCWFRSA